MDVKLLFLVALGLHALSIPFIRRTHNSLSARADEAISPFRALWQMLGIAGPLSWFATILMGFLVMEWWHVPLWVAAFLLAGGFVGGFIAFHFARTGNVEGMLVMQRLLVSLGIAVSIAMGLMLFGLV